jgi:hypothetical protein
MAPGLIYNSYLTNTTFVYPDPQTLEPFATGTPNFTGTITTVNADNPAGMAAYQLTNENTGGFNNFAISVQGYFLAPTTGSYTFVFSNGTVNNDDISFFYIGDSALSPTVNNREQVTVFGDSTIPFDGTNSYTISLTAGTYYPILLYYGQSVLGYSISLGFQLPGSSTTLYNGAGYFFTTNNPPICFARDSLLLCMNPARNREEAVAIQDLRKGDLVCTLRNGYVKVHAVGTNMIWNPDSAKRTKDRLYILRKNRYPDLVKDLIVTGAHSILVKTLTPLQKEGTIAALGSLFVTDGLYRLMAYLDERAEVYEPVGSFPIWHVALEHENDSMNYGIYANGLLVETCSKNTLRKMNA